MAVVERKEKTPPHRLPGGLGTYPSAFVRLAAVDKRFVVLVSYDRAALAGDLELRTARPAWADVLPGSGIPTGGTHLVAGVERRGASIVWKIASP